MSKRRAIARARIRPRQTDVQSRWSNADARATIERYRDDPQVNEDVALRVYTSRLIGQDPSLVLHGGGNTSVKTTRIDDTGREVPVLCVKGSGWDLGVIEPAGLPAVRLESLGALRDRTQLSDEEMVNAQRTRLIDANAPNPSVETLLHGFLPHKFIDHSHADAILALVDQPNAAAICEEAYGARLGVVPYVMAGFALAKLAADVYESDPAVEGLLLLRHGLFTFGDSAKESYERHIDAVDTAERFAAAKAQPGHGRREAPSIPYEVVAPILRGKLGAGERWYSLELRSTPAIAAFLERADLDGVTQRGPATPDHVIRTKRLPLLLELTQEMDAASVGAQIDARLASYREEYVAYVEREAAAKGRRVSPLDPDPRIILVPGLGLVAAGATEKAARIAADVYEHTLQVIEAAEAIGRYEALPVSDLFDMEYWSLEQAKLGKGSSKPLQGRAVYVSGAARGIGAATAAAFADAGASLYLTDRDEAPLREVAEALGAAFEVVDVSCEKAVRASVDHCVRVFGGLDGVVSNAGVAPQGAIDAVATDDLKRSFEVNFFSHQYLASAATRVFRAQGIGGFLLFNASKAAFNPGKGFGAYATAKAAVVALMKQYAIECGSLGVRSNAVNADRIRTTLLGKEDVQRRAKARGLDADAYYRSNLLAREVTAEDVARAFVNLALAPSTTGCVVTVDGGNIAASPR
jgi:rhamnose utilization protein RhaD (predicted bifunctional aldolase and dehydrogenase)/NAD(P)-dependent dehydrogenase (short-subunit alcohol dehydrogenase family)